MGQLTRVCIHRDLGSLEFFVLSWYQLSCFQFRSRNYDDLHTFQVHCFDLRRLLSCYDGKIKLLCDFQRLMDQHSRVCIHLVQEFLGFCNDVQDLWSYSLNQNQNYGVQNKYQGHCLDQQKLLSCHCERIHFYDQLIKQEAQLCQDYSHMDLESQGSCFHSLIQQSFSLNQSRNYDDLREFLGRLLDQSQSLCGHDGKTQFLCDVQTLMDQPTRVCIHQDLEFWEFCARV